MLIILAGITLNAVIGEEGIIFQAKDTKNMITNETAYDDKQLALLQNELRDDSIYSGIGIIPGTDSGGSSEGGESGSGSTGGGSGNTGSGNTNTGGTGGGTTGGGSVSGGNAEKPTIMVLEGEEIAASFYRSDVTIQIFTDDKTQKIKYILTTTVDEINNELYPSGLVKEIDIENGGTLTFTKDGEYTITAYAYDVYGVKSEATMVWLKRETGGTSGNGVTVTVASGNEGLNSWYTSNVTLRVLGTDTGSTRVTYQVKGVAYSNGTIGGEECVTGEIDTGEIDIPNGTTFQIAIDGDFAVVAYTYDSGGTRLSTAPTLNLKRDATRPKITTYTGTQVAGSGFKVEVEADDEASGLASSDRYTYKHKLATEMTYTDNKTQDETYTYKGLTKSATYDMYVVVQDEAGNRTSSDVVSKPSLWISNTPIAGETYAEGARSYYRSDVTLSMRGQDSNNVDISKVTYQIIGTTTGAGSINGTSYTAGTAMDETEIEIENNNDVISVPLQADGHWLVQIHTYNKEGERVTTNLMNITRDTVAPVISSFTITGVSTTKVKGTVSASDATSGIATSGGYKYYTGSTLNSTTTVNSYTYTLSTNTQYTLQVTVTDKVGHTATSSQSNIFSAYNFAYTGAQQTFTVPRTGTYKLEVWGAQGGPAATDHGTGGNGGYSTGQINLSSGSTIYAFVGGKVNTRL